MLSLDDDYYYSEWKKNRIEKYTQEQEEEKGDDY